MTKVARNPTMPKRGPGVVATVLCDSGQRHLTKFYNQLAWEDGLKDLSFKV